MSEQQIRLALHSKIVELAKEIGQNAKALTDSELIPSSGYLDSPGLMALIAWYELEFGLDIEQEDLTVDNFGTIDAMTAYVLSHS